MPLFDFAKNWTNFSKRSLSFEVIRAAEESIKNLLSRDNLTNYSFLDVGCGSGIFSIAARKLGACPVLGIDISQGCVELSKENSRKVGVDGIDFQLVSALDNKKLAEMQYDLVYAWGSLHHTGSMWEAIKNCSKAVAPSGKFVLAIYNKHSTSSLWAYIKYFYVQSPSFLQVPIVILFSAVIYIAKFAVTFKNPLIKQRGMNFWHDVIDWVGGYPYEYATSDEVIKFIENLGFKLNRVISAEVPTGCNEFVFDKADV